MPKVIETYTIEADGLNMEVDIVDDEKAFVRVYHLSIPSFGAGTDALLRDLKNRLVVGTQISAEKALDANYVAQLKKEFAGKARTALDLELPSAKEEVKSVLIGILLQQMLGLGEIEFLLSDGNLEEIVINNAKEPAWVYHKKYGWLKTNIVFGSEAIVHNYASIIARRVGKQITILNPLLDAHLITGDRANATLAPISSKGNTITIRRFRREPWTVTDLIENNTVNAEAMALIWLAIEYEMNIIISGGTGSGKTSFMNVIMAYIQPNNRVISIEDTRELQLPEYLHWVPMTTREPNPEGRGGVSMLDLLVNSLRQRPDRIIVGEVRRRAEAEVLFEAMHTGHSAYCTVHANTAAETIGRLTNPPIEIPSSLMDTVHLNVVCFRNRRLGIRRVFEVAEFMFDRSSGGEESVKPNLLYRWKAASDSLEKYNDSVRLSEELGMHTGLSKTEIGQELKVKKAVLNWLVKHKIHNIDEVGKVMASYYKDAEEIVRLVSEDRAPDWIKEEAKEAAKALDQKRAAEIEQSIGAIKPGLGRLAPNAAEKEQLEKAADKMIAEQLKKQKALKEEDEKEKKKPGLFGLFRRK